MTEIIKYDPHILLASDEVTIIKFGAKFIGVFPCSLDAEDFANRFCKRALPIRVKTNPSTDPDGHILLAEGGISIGYDFHGPFADSAAADEYRHLKLPKSGLVFVTKFN